MSGLPENDPIRFQTTHLSNVHRAQDGDAAAKGLLVRNSRRPLLAHALARCASREDAEDFTQEFIAQFISGDIAFSYNSAKGRFRSYLLRAFDNFINGQLRKRNAMERGGGAVHVVLDAQPSEIRAAIEPAAADPFAPLWDREWAQALTDRAMRRLRDSYGHDPRLFDLLSSGIGATAARKAAIAAELGVQLTTVGPMISRFVGEMRTCLRAEVADTVAHEGEVDGEMQYLNSFLHGGGGPR
jgi:DNA-directed RNA polymerase specialized sigma24 family protein